MDPLTKPPSSNRKAQRPRGAEQVLRVLNAFAISLLQQNKIDDLLWSIASNVGSLLRFEDCVIYLFRSDVLEQKAAFGLKNPSQRTIRNPILLKVGQGVVGQVALQRQSILIEDTSHCELYVSDDFPGLSEVSVPVIYQGRVLAVIDSEARYSGAYDEFDLDILCSMANIAAPRIASALEEERRALVEGKLLLATEELEERVKQRTAALVRSMQDLEHERHLLHLTMHAVGDGLFATDTNGAIMLASDAALRITGLERQGIIGLPLNSVYQTYNTRPDGLTRGAPQPLPRAEELTAPLARTLIFQKEAGDEFIIDEVISPIRNAQDKTIGLVVVFRDVTLERAMERKARKVLRLESLGVLAGGIAHDFNNILAGILGRINLAQACKDDALVLADAMQEAEKGCLAASGLTKQLLAFAKGGAPLKSVGSLRELIIDSARFCMHGSPVSLRLDLQPDLGSIEMDEVQISQALNNLILNALQSMPNGGELLLRARNEGQPIHSVVVTFKDSGSGISGPSVDHIFDPYFSTKSTHSGLGLASSELIIQRHKGQLRLVETSSAGTTFEFRLPAVSTPLRAPENQPAHSAALLSPMRILVMDDEPSVRNTMASMLRRLGQQVDVVPNGEQAIRLVEQLPPGSRGYDAAFLDLTIRGGMGGLRTVAHLRKLAPRLKAVVISGYSDDEVMASHADHGFEERLAKPFTLRQLREVLQKLVPRPPQAIQ